MEEVTGSHQKLLQVLLKKMLHQLHGTQLNLEKFLTIMSRKQQKLLLLRILLKPRELLLTDFWMTTISERHSMRKLELELDKLPCKEEVLPHNTGMHHHQQRKVLVASCN